MRYNKGLTLFFLTVILEIVLFLVSGNITVNADITCVPSCGAGQTCNCSGLCGEEGSTQNNSPECQCSCSGGGGGTCEVTSSCPPGTLPDWSQVSYGCGHWGKVCGDNVVRGGSAVCSCCTYGCYHVNKKNTVCEWDCPTPCKLSSVKYAACVAACSATAPTALTYTASNQTLTWASGTGGNSQRLYVSADANQVTSNCTLGSSPGCIVNDNSASSPYSLAGTISPGVVYYAAVTNYKDASCSTDSSNLSFLSSCAFQSPSLSVTQGDLPTPFNLSVNSNSAITNTTFSSSDTGVATVTTPDTSYTYSTSVLGNNLGSATLTGNVYFGATLACTNTAVITVLSPNPWWQVKDGDTSSNGNLTANVPPNDYFDLDGAGGFPGVAAYGGTTDLAKDTVSTTGWLAQSTNASQKIFNYQYFANQAPGDTVFNSVNPADAAGSLSGGGTADTNGYYWYKYMGGADLSIDTPVNLGGRKVILFIDSADLYINAPINLDDGSGFLLVIVGKTTGGTKGNIIVGSTVGGSAYDLEGLYMADGLFQTGISSTTLKIRGSVTGYDGISMQRDLTASGNVNPSEFFEYAPDQILLFPKQLSTRKINWKEVAP